MTTSVSRRRWPWLAAFVVALAALGALAYLDRAGDAPAPVSTGPGGQAAPAATDTTDPALRTPAYWREVGHGAGFVTGLESLPASLAGTTVPDGLAVDANGNLLVNGALRDVFEYFLSVVGEEDIERIIGRIRAHLGHALPGTAAGQANALLDNYLAWRAALADLPQAGGGAPGTLDPAALRAQQAATRELRTRFLDAGTVEAFFADEDRWDDYALSRLQVMNDASLTISEKARRTAQLRDALPASLREEVAAVSLYTDLKALTQELKAAGGTDAELRTLREQVVGPEAADRLEQLDAQRGQFQQRLAAWIRERNTLRETPGLAPADVEAQLDRLRAERFPDEDPSRMRALEHIADTEGLQALQE